MANFFNRNSNRPRPTREETHFLHKEKLRKIGRSEKVLVTLIPYLPKIIIAITTCFLLTAFVFFFHAGKLNSTQFIALTSGSTGISLMLSKLFGQKD